LRREKKWTAKKKKEGTDNRASNIKQGGDGQRVRIKGTNQLGATTGTNLFERTDVVVGEGSANTPGDGETLQRGLRWRGEKGGKNEKIRGVKVKCK